MEDHLQIHEVARATPFHSLSLLLVLLVELLEVRHHVLNWLLDVVFVVWFVHVRPNWHVEQD